MSVIYKCQLGTFLSHYLPSEEVLSIGNNDPCYGDERDRTCRDVRQTEPNCCRQDKGHKMYRWKSDLFAVNAPFMMDSQVDRINREVAVIDSGGDVKETSAQRKRKKKSRNKPVLSKSEKKASEVICHALPSLIAQARELNYLGELLPSSSPLCSNNAARTAAQIDGCGSLFQELCSDLDEEDRDGRLLSSDVIVLAEDMLSFRASSILGRRICNMGDAARSMLVDNYQFVIPHQSSFLMSGFNHFVAVGHKQLQVKEGYNLIVIDPPWNNKSVKRKRSYNMIQETDLKQIPVADLAARNCLVCVWLTNNDRIESFVIEELFPHWSVDLITQWFWMKVTTRGEPICDILSPHKKPYEKLLIGCVKKPLLNVSEVGSSDSPEIGSRDAQAGIDKESGSLQVTSPGFSRTSEDKVQDIPTDFLLVSVPCSLHSKKPSLADIMSQYLPSKPRCLELFARNLTPGWFSWGNEPLLHQHVDYFEQVQ